MANRKRTHPKKTQVVKKVIDVNIPEVQAQTLVSIEQVMSQSPKINGVPILQCCTYDVIQMLNGLFVAEITK